MRVSAAISDNMVTGEGPVTCPVTSVTIATPCPRALAAPDPSNQAISSHIDWRSARLAMRRPMMGSLLELSAVSGKRQPLGEGTSHVPATVAELYARSTFPSLANIAPPARSGKLALEN